ncbi:MAG: replication-relaxation family protein [Fimbriimonadales bacterium]
MRVTRRDIGVVSDIALSHVLSRDQILRLDYFNSITRVNTRLRELTSIGLIARLDTPFFGQSLYMATKRAAEVVGESIAPLIQGRTSSPRFIQHALQVTNVRLALIKKGEGAWRFEQQLWRKLSDIDGREVRPDGLFLARSPIFIEVDMGHAGLPRFKEKLLAYHALATSDQCESLYGFPNFKLLTVTTGHLRASHLRRALPPDAGFEYLVKTFAEVGATPIPQWS